jgi:hypothetical protein
MNVMLIDATQCLGFFGNGAGDRVTYSINKAQLLKVYSKLDGNLIA